MQHFTFSALGSPLPSCYIWTVDPLAKVLLETGVNFLFMTLVELSKLLDQNKMAHSPQKNQFHSVAIEIAYHIIVAMVL